MTEEKRKRRFWRLVGAIVVSLGFIAFFAWSEYRTGTFYWWHVYVLVGVVIAAVVVNYWARVRQGLARMIDKIGPGEVRRDYLMALVPMYFIVSAYLMQSALKDGNLDMVPMILSIVILVFAIYLMVAAVLINTLPKPCIRTTYQIASSLAIIGAVIFIINVLSVTNELNSQGANNWYVQPFFYGGLVVTLGIMVFHLINLYGDKK